MQDACFSQPDILYKMACMLLYAGADAVSCRQAPNCSADMMAKYEVQQNIITKKNNSRDHVDKMLRTPKAFREWEPMLYIDDVAHMTKRKDVYKRQGLHRPVQRALPVLFCPLWYCTGRVRQQSAGAETCRARRRGPLPFSCQPPCAAAAVMPCAMAKSTSFSVLSSNEKKSSRTT